MFVIHPPQRDLAAICEPILRALPQWFGIEAATRQYVQDIERHLTFVAYDDGSPVGFLTIVDHSAFAAEIHVMGVRPDYHRQGIGRSLVQTTENFLRQQQTEFLQVKTLSARHPDPDYQRTRAFYLALGFRPLEEFPDLWGPDAPCLQLIKAL